mgnify:CR=1 FL=1|jgi:hypothetical protein
MPKSGQVTTKATGKLFENIQDDLDVVASNMNERMISI